MNWGSGAPIKDADGKILGAVLVFRDITERRRVEKERALLAGIVESSEDAIISKNLDGVIELLNIRQLDTDLCPPVTTKYPQVGRQNTFDRRYPHDLVYCIIPPS